MIPVLVEKIAIEIEKNLHESVIRGDDYVVIKKQIDDTEREFLRERFDPQLIEVSDLDGRTMVKL